MSAAPPPTGVPPAATAAQYFARLTKPQHMDFESAAWLMWQLLAAPRAAHRAAAYQKQTKGFFARDDPAFAVAVAAVAAGASAAFSAALARSPGQAVLALLRAVVVDYLALGLVLATIAWLVVNRGLASRGGGGGAGGAAGGGGNGWGGAQQQGQQQPQQQQQQQQQRVEWLYAFDVHCSAFFASAVPVLMAAQLVLLPVLLAGGGGGTRTGGGGAGAAAAAAGAAAAAKPAPSSQHHEPFFAAFVACTLYLVGLARYSYAAFLGFAALPFAGRRADALLWPVGAACCLYPLALLLRFNPARFVLGTYYPG
jgi:hypothetical protein